MDGYNEYRRYLSEAIEAHADDMDDFDREAIRWGDEEEAAGGVLSLGAGRIAREMVLHGLRRRSANPIDRAVQDEYDRQALALERKIIHGIEPGDIPPSSEEETRHA